MWSNAKPLRSPQESVPCTYATRHIGAELSAYRDVRVSIQKCLSSSQPVTTRDTSILGAVQDEQQPLMSGGPSLHSHSFRLAKQDSGLTMSSLQTKLRQQQQQQQQRQGRKRTPSWCSATFTSSDALTAISCGLLCSRHILVNPGSVQPHETCMQDALMVIAKVMHAV